MPAWLLWYGALQYMYYFVKIPTLILKVLCGHSMSMSNKADDISAITL